MTARPSAMPGATRSGSATAARTLTTLLGALVALAGGPWAAAGVAREPSAVAARSVYLVETAHLHLISEGESSLNERGHASGTYSATLTAHLDLSTSRVNAVFTLYPHGGTIEGRASARFVVRGSTGYYGGTLRIVRGTGAYRRAAGSNIGISGTISRYSFALTVKASGWMRL